MATTRRLAAIMFTDIVGYSSLMTQDEGKAMELLQKNKLIQKPIIERYQGKWIKEIGDGVLASFDTVSDAVLCAVDIQKICESEPDLSLRIGIHQGEVVFQGGDVFGDGVNIASRLQDLAPAGGIWISESVNRNILNKQGIETRYIREEQLKNVKKPVRIYQVSVHNLEHLESVPAVPKTKEKNGTAQSRRKVIFISIMAAAALIVLYLLYRFYNREVTFDGPRSIAVLAFNDQSPNGDQEWLGDGIADEILNVLAHTEGLKVSGKTSSFSFKEKNATIKEIGRTLDVKTVLEGSVSQVDNKLRITAQLIEVETDKHIWSDKYDREAEHIFTIIDEVAQSIVGALKVELSIEDYSNIKTEITTNEEAYLNFLKGQHILINKYYGGGREEDFHRIKQLFENAIAIDSNYALAYAGLGDLWDTYRNTNPTQESEALRRAFSKKAFQLDPNSAWVNYVRCVIFAKPDHINIDSAYYYAARTLQIEPNNAFYLFMMGLDYFKNGLHQRAIPYFEKAIQLDPLDPIFYPTLGRSYEMVGDTLKANRIYQTAIDLAPADVLSYMSDMVSWLITQNRFEEAEKIIETWKQINPNLKEVINLNSFLLAVQSKKKEDIELINSHYYQIISFITIGLKDQALQTVESLIDQGSNYYLWMVNNHLWTPYHNDPEFIRISGKAKTLHESNLNRFPDVNLFALD